MVEQSRTLDQPWLEPSALVNLLDELRADGYNIGIGQYIAVNDLLLALAARGEPLEDPQRLQSLIGPLLCSSPSEQGEFPLHFDAWLNRLGRVAPAAPATALGTELATIERGARGRRLIIAVGVTAAIVSAGALLLSIASFISAQPTGGGGSGAQPRPPFRFDLFMAQVFAFISRQSALIALLALLAAFVGWRLWLRYRANLFLTRRATNRQPEIARVALAGLEHEVLPPLMMFRVARDFRRRIEAPSDEIDIDATIARTMDRGGWFTPAYRRRLVPPEYLVLIDRATLRDHQARLATEMVAALTERDVIIITYYFDGDPRVCTPARPGATLRTLRELADEYGQYRLIIFTDARNLFSLVTGQLEPWVETFALWPDRALLTPEPPAHWGYYERALAEQFVVLPSTNDGLVELIRHFERREVFAESADGAVSRLPEELHLRSRRWLGRAAPAVALVEDVLEQLRGYLGSSGYNWLSACAVYPALQWNLTLYLGSALRDAMSTPLVHAASLLDLARLPWFRHGMMPDWLRARLIDDMSPEQERAVRAALAALLATAAEGGNADAALEVARRPGGALDALAKPLLRRLARDAREEGPLRDYVFLSFLAGRRQRLAVRAPTTFRSLIFGSYRGISGWQLWLRWTLANAIACAPVLTLSLGVASFPIISSLGRIGPRGIISDIIIFGILGFLSGGFVSTAQWWTLRRYRLPVWRWILRLTLCLTASAVTTSTIIVSSLSPSIFGYVMLLFAPIMFYGLWQWWILRRYARNSWLMILGNLLGAGGGFGADFALISTGIVSPSGPNLGTIFTIVVGAFFGLIYGAISGLFLLRVLRRWRQPGG